MRTHYLPDWLRRLLIASAAHRYYPLVVASVAFVSTVTFSFPFAVALVPSVLLCRKRWLLIGLLCGVASGCGAAVLVEIFHQLGQAVVLSRFSNLVELESWRLASQWLQNYGVIALLVIAASPIPQTPALLFCALAEVSIPGVFFAVGIGKSIKYVFLAWVTARYPARLLRFS